MQLEAEDDDWEHDDDDDDDNFDDNFDDEEEDGDGDEGQEVEGARGPGLLDDLDKFAWLSSEEKAAVRARLATDPDAVKTASAVGFLIAMDYKTNGAFGKFTEQISQMYGGSGLERQWTYDKEATEEKFDELGGDIDDDDVVDEFFDLFDRVDTDDPDELVGTGPPLHGYVALDPLALAEVQQLGETAVAADVERAFARSVLPPLSERFVPEKMTALALNGVRKRLGSPACPRLPVEVWDFVAHEFLMVADTRKAWVSRCEADAARINRLLIEAGVADPDSTSACVRGGLLCGAFGFNFTGAADELEFPVFTDRPSCSSCGEVGMEKCNAKTIREALVSDFEVLATPFYSCRCEFGGVLTNACCGQPQIDRIKFHNHCKSCPGLGTCVGDSRNRHCEHCHRHPFVGTAGAFPCKCRPLRRAVKRALTGDRAAIAALAQHETVFGV